MKDQIVISQKRHICDICGFEIQKGRKYHNMIILPSEDYENGEFHNYHIHFECLLLYELMREHDVRDAQEGLIDEEEWEEYLEILEQKLTDKKLI